VKNETLVQGMVLGMRGIILYATIPAIFIGLVCMAGGVFIGYSGYAERKDSQLVDAVITDTDSAAGFRYMDAEGKEILARSRNSVSPSPYHVGQEVKAYVRPSDPSHGSIDSFSDQWAMSLFMLVFGALFVLIPGMILKVFWSVTGIASGAVQSAPSAESAVGETPASTIKPGEPGAPTDPVTWV
jgi:hypothetical protein